MPKYSIIVPAFNAEDRLDKSLGSIKSQVFTDYELIVVCDRCKDNTEKIAREQYGAITAEVDFGNDGLTRSKGLDMATGEWVLFMDDDDWWLHEYVLAIIDQAIEKCKDWADILQFSFIWKGKGYYISKAPTQEQIQTGSYSVFSNVWTKCFKRSFIGDTRFPNIHSISDAKFLEQLAQKMPRFAFLDHPCYYYNFAREGSISKKDIDTYGTNVVPEERQVPDE